MEFLACDRSGRCFLFPSKVELFLDIANLNVLVGVSGLMGSDALHALLEALEVVHDFSLAEAGMFELSGEGSTEHFFGRLLFELTLAGPCQLEEPVSILLVLFWGPANALTFGIGDLTFRYDAIICCC